MLDNEKLLRLYPPYTTVLGPYKRKDGRQHVVLNNNAVHKGEKGKTKTISYPKAVMESNLCRRLMLDEEVDHVDGNKLNDTFDNYQILNSTLNRKKQALEGNNSFWGQKETKNYKVTPIIKHNSLSILARNILTNEILSFHSTKACADHFDIHRATFWKHLNTGNSQKFQKDNYVFKFDDGKHWINHPSHLLKTLGSANKSVDIFVFDKQLNKTIIFETLLEASEYTNIPTSTLSNSIFKSQKYESNKYLVKKLIKTQ